MTNTKARWYRSPGAKPVYEPQRPGRDYPRTPDERRNYPTPPDPTPRRPPGVPVPSHNDPRFRPGGPYGPQVKPEIPPVRGPRPVSPKRFPVPGAIRLPKPRPFRFPRPIPGLGGPAVAIIPFVEPLIFPDNSRKHPPILPYNYKWCWGPFDWPSDKDWGDATYGPAFLWYGECFSYPGPLTGQVAEDVSWSALPQYGAFAQITQFDEPVAYWWRNYNFTEAIPYRGAAAGTAIRVGPSLNPQPSPHWPLISMTPAPNPNLQRWWPIAPQPWDPPLKPVEELVPGVAVPTVTNPDSPYEPDHAWSWEPVFGLAPVVFAPPVTNNPPEVPAPPTVRLPPSQREAPPPGTRQRKAIAAAKVAVAIYKGLDWASEAAEVVDAIYDALPKKARDRWEKDRGAHWVKDYVTGKWKKVGLERPGDNFGQYGLDGADWKLQAIYHNLHQLDLELAFRNIVKNHLSDLVIGGMQRKLPNNTGNAHADGEREVAKWLDDIFTGELGL